MIGRRMGFLAQTRHVLLKDLVRDVWVLLGISGLMALEIGGVLPGTEVLGGGFRSPLPLGLFPILLSLLAVRVVQADHPTDDRTLWSTSPLRPAAVAAAKGAYIGIFLCAVPVLVQATWFEHLEPAAPGIALTRDSMIYVFGVTFLAAAGGALTRSMRGFLTLVLGFYLLTVVLAVLPFGGGSPVATDRGVMATRAALEHAGWFVIGACLLAHQYRTRRRIQGALLGLFMLTLLPVLVGRSTLDLSEEPVTVESPTAAVASDSQAPTVDLTLRELRREAHGRYFRRENEGITGSFSGEAPVGLSYHPRAVWTHLETGNREASGEFEVEDDFGGLSRLVVPNIPGLTPARDRFRPGGTSPVFFTVPLVGGPTEDLDELLGGGRMEVRFSLEIHDWREVGRAELRPGATIHGGPMEHVSLEMVRKGPRGVMLALVHRWSPGSTLVIPPAFEPEDLYTFVLHSRRYDEFMGSLQVQTRPYRQRTVVGGAWLREVPLRVEFHARMVERSRSDDALPADWFDDVELIVLRRHRAGSMSRTFGWDISSWPAAPGHVVRIDSEGDPIGE